MKRIKYIFATGLLLFSTTVLADCFTNQSGKVVCGKGQCESDDRGNVYCANAGGGAMRNRSGKVFCGVGYCAQDYLGKVWCSKEQGGSAATDSNGKVKCLNGCDEGSFELCSEGQ